METAEKRKIMILVGISIFVAALIRIPQIFGFDAGVSFFYEKNVVLFVFLGIALYVILTAETFLQYALCTSTYCRQT